MGQSDLHITDSDRQWYARYIKDSLPETILDFHAEIGTKASSTDNTANTWGTYFDEGKGPETYDVENLVADYRVLFPDKNVKPLLSGRVSSGEDVQSLNDYVAESASRYGFMSLMVNAPEWSSVEFEEKLTDGAFFGIKAHPRFAPAYIPPEEVRLLDFLPPHQLDVLNKRGMIAVVTVPRSIGLKDEMNLNQILEIEQNWPDVNLVIANTGNVCTEADLQETLDMLNRTEKVRFELSGNWNQAVFEAFIRHFGAKRLLFGSELPYTRSTPTNAVAGVSSEKSSSGTEKAGNASGSGEGEHAEACNQLVYRTLGVLCRAGERTDLSTSDLQDVLYNNADALLSTVKEFVPHKQLQMLVLENGLHPKEVPSLSDEYEVRAYREEDAEAYAKLMRQAGFGQWGYYHFKSVLRKTLPNALFFAVYKPTRELAATACGMHNPDGQHPFGAEIGWVAVAPEHRGQKLGFHVTAAVVRRLQEAGYERIYLKTDDYRLAAIKTYLNLGMVPYLMESDMERRWQDVCGKLGVDYESLEKVWAPLGRQER